MSLAVYNMLNKYMDAGYAPFVFQQVDDITGLQTKSSNAIPGALGLVSRISCFAQMFKENGRNVKFFPLKSARDEYMKSLVVPLNLID